MFILFFPPEIIIKLSLDSFHSLPTGNKKRLNEMYCPIYATALFYWGN